MNVQIRSLVGTLSFLLLIGLSTSGCGQKGPEMYKVSGTLTHNGKPIPKVEVVFFPQDTGKFRESFATTDDQGKFVMMYGANEGVAPGSHTVFIRDPAVAMGMASDQIKDPEILATIKKYGNEKTSPMKITVDKDLTDYELKLD